MHKKWTYGNAYAFTVDKTKDGWGKFYRKDGKLKAYAFACGYIERYFDNGTDHEISLSMIYSSYAIHESNPGFVTQTSWFRTLLEARGALKTLLS